MRGLSFREPSTTSWPSRNTRHRNPSHFGSNQKLPSGPSGSAGEAFANMGASGGCTGRSMTGSYGFAAGEVPVVGAATSAS